MDEWLELAEMARKDRGVGLRFPVPVGRVSNGEYPVQSPDEGQRLLGTRLLELADLYASRLRMDRREFLRTSCGLAAAFLAINSIHGSLFAVSAAEAADPDAARQSRSALSRQFIFDVQTHFVNDTYTAKDDPEQAPAVRFATETAVSLIQPYVPHIAEELWQRFGRERLWKTPWPEADPALLERETFELVVQVNGRVRGRVEVPAELDDDELVVRAKELPRVAAHLDGKEVKNAIVVPGRLVNLVV